MGLPGREDTTANKMTFIEAIETDVLILTNDTGASLASGAFAVIADKWAAIVGGEAIANAASGNMRVDEGLHFQTDNLKAAEDTFATVGAEVYWDAVTNEFSDTETDGYWNIGTVFTVKDANDVVVIEKYRYAVLIASST